MNRPQRILVIGHTDVGRRTCSALHDAGVESIHLGEPSDAELRAIMHEVDGVAVMLHDDIRALRYGLVVEHIRPGIRLFVAMFARTVREQLQSAVPNCVVLSPAAISVPSIVAAAISPEHSAIRRATSQQEDAWVAIDAPQQSVMPWHTPRALRLRGWLGRTLAQFRPYDAGSAVLISGAIGLLLVIIADTLVGMRHEEPLRALYDAARTTATIAAPELPNEPGLLVWSTIAAILVMGLTAIFGAGIVHHLLSGRHVALFGRRVAPRSGHVIIAGMGQVGVRLAQELRALGIAVVGLDRNSNAAGSVIARMSNIPILIGNASSQHMLRRAGIGKCIAVIAAGSDDRDNVAMAVAALGVRPDVRVVLRAGSDEAIDETTSLFHVGSVVDVNGLTASFVVRSMVSATPYAVVATGHSVACVDDTGQPLGPQRSVPARCTCSS